MNNSTKFKLVLVAAAWLVLPAAHSAVMAKADYESTKTRIKADYTNDKAACN